MSIRDKSRLCARTLDRPITIMGLEPEEFVLIGVSAGVVMFLIDPVPAVLLGVGLAVLLKRVKSGKPDGYLYYLAYRSGLVRYLPASLRVPHVLKPPPPGRPRKIRLSAAPGEEEDHAERYYRHDRPYID